MPVEIRELQITAVVQDAATSTNVGGTQVLDNTEIISKCVEQVLEILKQKNER